MTRLIDAIVAIALAAFLLGMIVGRATAMSSAVSRPANLSHTSAASRAGEAPTGAVSGAESRNAMASPGAMTAEALAPTRFPSPAALRRPSADPTAAVVHAGIIEGLASWYVWPGHDGLYAALPGPWKPGRTVMVCGPDSECFGGIPVVTSCGCPGGRVIDLSPAAFGRLAPLSQGLVMVRMTVFGGGS